MNARLFPFLILSGIWDKLFMRKRGVSENREILVL
jgi:hypothetical protein